jgi:hypothetical protein
MPDTDPPKVTMADENLLPTQAESDQELPKRRWTCPPDDAIASFVDGTLPENKKAGLELHLCSCEHCRQIVADVVKAQREMDLAPPPSALVYKAIRAASLEQISRRWYWIPAGVVATIVAMLLAISGLLRQPNQAAIPPSHIPLAPLVARNSPEARPIKPVPDVVRKQTTIEALPSIIFPQSGSVVGNERLRFSWKQVPHARSYQVRLVTSDGDIVWEGETQKTILTLPADFTLKDGSYFVWITSYVANGRKIKSSPVGFVVKG